MSRPQQLQLKRLCHRKETYDKAQTILQTAQVTTGPGTGYDLGQGASGLAAICAYIASTELGNGDVPEKVAQISSCLAPKIFKSTLNIVNSALVAAAKAEDEEDVFQALMYEDLIKQFRFSRGDFMVTCMKEAESTIIASRELRGRLEPPNDTVTVVVFYWVCIILNLKRSVQRSVLEKDYSVSAQDFDDVLDIITSTCDLVAKDIKQKVADIRAASRRSVSNTPSIIRTKSFATSTESSNNSTPLPSPSKSVGTSPSKSIFNSPTKSSLRSSSKSIPQSPSKSVLKSPSKSALKSTSSVESSPTKTPTHKRKVAWDASLEDVDGDDELAMDTPSKKRPKLSTSPTRTPRPGGDTPRQRGVSNLTITEGSSFGVSRAVLTPAASSSRLTLDLIEASRTPGEDEDVKMGSQALPSRTATATTRTPSVTPDPSTPRRKRTTSGTFPPTPTQSDYDATPSKRRLKRAGSSQSLRSQLRDEESARPRRNRPVLLCHKQWRQRDPRVEKEWKLAEVAKEGLVEKFGYPFEKLRLAAMAAGVGSA